MLDIKSRHADMLTGMSVQALKVSAYNQQKSAEMQNENSMKMEMDKEKMAADTTSKKNEMDFQIKQAEIDVKRAALSAVD